MPTRTLAAREQEIDRGRRARPSLSRWPVLKSLGENARLRDAAQDRGGRITSAADRFGINVMRSRPVLALADFGEHLPCRLAGETDRLATSGRSARRNGFAAFSSAERRGNRRPVARHGAVDLRLARGQRRHCRARWSWRSGCSPACIHGRNRCGVSSGRARSFSSDCHIISGVPSMTRPQPIENSVSPTKASLSRCKEVGDMARGMPRRLDHLRRRAPRR